MQTTLTHYFTKMLILPVWLIIMLLFVARGQSVNLLKDNGMSGYTPSANMYEDGDGLIGIGTATPSALLHINKAWQQSDFLLVTRTIISGTPPNNITVTEHPVFTITDEGYVGIGNAVPASDLFIHTHSYGEDEWGKPVLFVRDDHIGEDGNLIAALLNTGTQDYASGAFLVNAHPESVIPGLGIVNFAGQILAFGVRGDGTVSMGFDVSQSFEPIAQLDIRKYNEYSGHNYILNVASANNTPMLMINNDGYVGMGITPSSNARLALYNAGGDTRFDIIPSSGNNSAIRFMAHSNSQPRHLITETNGDFVIDPGVANGGGNDRLVVSGNEQVTGDLDVAGNVRVRGDLSIISSNGIECKVYNNGFIRAREVQIDLTTIPDYVFSANYQLRGIDELETFVKQHKHLPNVPGEKELEQKGNIALSDLNLRLLEKVEELSLYIIQLHQRIKTLENENK